MLISSISDVDWCCCKWVERATRKIRQIYETGQGFSVSVINPHFISTLGSFFSSTKSHKIFTVLWAEIDRGLCQLRAAAAVRKCKVGKIMGQIPPCLPCNHSPTSRAAPSLLFHTSSADSPTLNSNASAAGMLSIHEPASVEHIRPVRSVL
jgi:hypothetical protein